MEENNWFSLSYQSVEIIATIAITITAIMMRAFHSEMFGDIFIEDDDSDLLGDSADSGE